LVDHLLGGVSSGGNLRRLGTWITLWRNTVPTPESVSSNGMAGTTLSSCWAG
jgi:hypothetical protein